MIPQLKDTIHQSLKNPIYSNGFWLLLDKIIRNTLNYLLLAWIARSLGTESFGLWNYAISFVAIIGVLSSLGLYNVFLNEIILQPIKTSMTVGSSIVIKTLGGLSVVVVSYLGSYLINDISWLLRYLILITSLNYVAQSLDIFEYYFHAITKSKYVVIARGISFIILAVVKIIYLLRGGTVVNFAWIMTIEFALSAFILAFLYINNTNNKIQFDYNTSKLILKMSLPLALTEVAIIIYMKTDQIMIGEMINTMELGQYAAAVRLSEIWSFLPLIIINSFYPSILSLKNENMEKFKAKFMELINFLFWLAIALAILITINSWWIVSLLFGPEYYKTPSLLNIHVWSSIFVFTGIALGRLATIYNLQKYMMIQMIIGALLNICLNFVLLPKIGVKGAAISTLISQAFTSWLGFIIFPETRSIFLFLLKSIYRKPFTLLK